ncbi:hypothetical protein CL617_02175 [archaeon]|nr:hypothetical protein [archaeon]|tara:strand:+ start:7436 stop:7819 length:384 start_codon:yes stop_codon:yes gene_type:complete
MKKILVGLFVLFTIFLVGCSGVKHTQESVDVLANCLADKNVKEYGAFWCPNCAKQQKMFGPSYSIIKERNVYVECDPRGDHQQANLCLEKEIQRYPHWEFPDGSFEIGAQDLEILAERSGCEKPIRK